MRRRIGDTTQETSCYLPKIATLEPSLISTICCRPLLLKFLRTSSMWAITADSLPSLPLNSKNSSSTGVKLSNGPEKQTSSVLPACKLAGCRTDNVIAGEKSDVEIIAV